MKKKPLFVPAELKAIENLPEAPVLAPGIIRQIVEANLKSALIPQPILALAGAMCAISTAIGRKVCDCQRMTPNIYAVSVARSGHGKQHAEDFNNKLFRLSGGSHLLVGGAFDSDDELMKFIHRTGAVMIQADQFSDTLERVARYRNCREANLLDELKTLYTSANQFHPYRESRGKHKDFSTYWPHVVLHWMNTPDHFWKNLIAYDTDGALTSRLSIFEPREFSTFADPESRGINISDDVLSYVRFWISQSNSPGNEDPVVTTIPFAPEAEALRSDRSKAVAEWIQEGGGIERGIFIGSSDNVSKYAMIFASSRAGATRDFQVEQQDVELAIQLADWQVATTLRRLDEYSRQ